MRAFVTLLLAAVLVPACGGDDSVGVLPGAVVRTEGGEGNRRVEVATLGGTITSEQDGNKHTITSSAGGLVGETETGLTLADLGVPVPDGVRLKRKQDSIVAIRSPAGSQVIGSLETELSPDQVVAFFEGHFELRARTVVNDAAVISALLEDGRTLSVMLGPPKSGVRDLVVTVTTPPGK